MRCINPGLLCRRSCGEREAPTFSLAILNVKYRKPTRNFNYSELPSGINAALEATGHPNVPDPQGTPGDLIIYPGPTGRAETFLPGGNATARALYECNFARAGLQINAPTATAPHLYSTVPVNAVADGGHSRAPAQKCPSRRNASQLGRNAPVVEREFNENHWRRSERHTLPRGGLCGIALSGGIGTDITGCGRRDCSTHCNIVLAATRPPGGAFSDRSKYCCATGRGFAASFSAAPRRSNSPAVARTCINSLLA
jgi:hypothetical protein